MTRRKISRLFPEAWGPVTAECRNVLLLKLGSSDAVDALVEEATSYAEGDTPTDAAVQRQQADVARALLRQVERAQRFATRHPGSNMERLLAPLQIDGLRALANERPSSGRPPGRRPALLTWPRAIDLDDRQIGALVLLVANRKGEKLSKHSRKTPADRLRDETKAIKRARETTPWIIDERRRLLGGEPRWVAPLVAQPTFPGLGLAAAAPFESEQKLRDKATERRGEK